MNNTPFHVRFRPRSGESWWELLHSIREQRDEAARIFQSKSCEVQVRDSSNDPWMDWYAYCAEHLPEESA